MLLLHAALLENDLQLWAETSESPAKSKGRPSIKHHPFAAGAEDLKKQLEAAGIWEKKTKAPAEFAFAWLPSGADGPRASSPLLNIPAKSGKPKITPWYVETLRLPLPAALTLLGKALQGNPLHPGIIASEDLLFWGRLMRFAGSLIARQSYVPDLVADGTTYRARWRPVLTNQEIHEFSALITAMPAAARALSNTVNPPAQAAETVLDRFLATVVDALVRETGAAPRPLVPLKGKPPAAPAPNSVHDAWVQALLAEKDKVNFAAADLAALEQEVRRWQRPLEVETATPWRLCFRLEEPLLQMEDAEDEGLDDEWEVRYLLQARDEPSLLVPLAQAWMPDTPGHKLLRRAGSQAPEYLLTALGQASGLVPEVAASLRGQVPGGFTFKTEGAFRFLTESAATLENAGFGVFLPSWWSRHGSKSRLTARANVRSPKFTSASDLTMEKLVKFDWQIALGGESLTVQELSQLAELKSSLVRFRGQWVQVNPEQLQQALKFWKKRGEAAATAGDLLRLALGAPGAEEAVAEDTPGDLEVESVTAEGWFADMLQRLTGGAKLEALPTPAGFGGKLRPYQESGYSWMEFLGQWGLGACLADDMGLGKTVQVLALLQHHWEHAAQNGGTKPVLLICPTSVVFNWQKEAAKFTPDLPVYVHHGAARRKTDLRDEAADKAMVISSYALLHRDAEQFKAVEWNGVVLDEAQYIKNSQTHQAKAARSLQSDFRIAMTGTPVENNVGDLWSLMEFLNPGLLGSQSEFRKRFFIPIQSNSNPEAVERLKKLAGPFILRRLKTDKSVIADLPDKVETKAYCNLTREQASLYSAVVDEAMALVENKEGIDRRGAVLAMLSKLKQVCNHPAQFLKDGTAIGERSGKLNRLQELVEEMLLENDNGLIFTQFHEMGEIIQRHLQDTFGREVLFLHGGTTKKARDEMVTRFQDHENPRAPRLFILSLKAGGVGLNLTRANHVFHFDRWWNPAVENQATDRAFRIGQQKNVQVHKFLCVGTLEEKIDEMIEAKQSLATNVLGAGENWLTELSNTELRDLLTLQGSAISE